MQMIQDARRVPRCDYFSYALFSQKAQKRTVVQWHNISTVNHFISLPEITYSVRFRQNSEGKYEFHSLLLAHVKDGTPMYLPVYNVNECGLACFGNDIDIRFEGNSIGEIAEFAVSAFWNSKFDESYRATRKMHYANTPFADFKTWAKYTRKHPDWIPEPNVPIEEENVWFKSQSWFLSDFEPLPPENSR